MEDVLGHETVYLIARDADGQASGVLPLVHVVSALFGNYLLSMPFLNYGGPLGSGAARLALLNAARDEAVDRRVDLLEVRTRDPIISPLQVSNRKITVILDLPDDLESLWMGHLRGKVRTMVRRARKEGMQVRFGPDQRDAFYQVLSVTMRDLGTPALSRRFFEAVVAHLQPWVRIGVVYSASGAPAAAGFGFLWKGEFEMTWAGSRREYQRFTVNEYLYWSFMEMLIGEGADAFNFGRCTPGSGTHRWKQKWEGREVALPWLQWTPAATPSPDRPLYRAATWVWSHLPLAVTERLGPPLASSLP
jgi:FemAB-related protein (PEP-CTERM system-associated)